MDTMKAIVKLSPTAKDCLDRLMELVIEENRQENEQLCSYDLYDTYCAQVQKALNSQIAVILWENYKNLQNEETDFFDPKLAYIAGRDAKLDGEMDKNIAYKFYLSDIKNSQRFQDFKKGQELVFKDLLHSLETEYLQNRLIKLDQLHKRLYAPFEKNLWIFFNLGYDCCPA